MPRYKLTIEYDGTPYSGWQLQANGRTVQGALEEAVRRFAGATLRVSGCGRTDAGVHAVAQVAHVDLAKAWRTDVVRDAMNAHLKLMDDSIAITAAEVVPETFDARFSARRRHYLYRIINRRPPAPLEALRAWHVVRPLNIDVMNNAAAILHGQHDFTTFRAAICQAKSPVKTLDVLECKREGEIVEVRASARSFLHNQVRSMVGSLVEVGLGRWTVEDMRRALEARDHARCGPNAPPFGLYFMAVEY